MKQKTDNLMTVLFELFRFAKCQILCVGETVLSQCYRGQVSLEVTSPVSVNTLCRSGRKMSE